MDEDSYVNIKTQHQTHKIRFLNFHTKNVTSLIGITSH